MKKILTILLTLITISCANQEVVVKKEKPVKEFLARVTYYWPGEAGQFGNQTSTGVPAKCGESAAIDPKIIPYGTTIIIPKMQRTLVAVDTGSAVKSRRASKKLGRNNIVIDIFCKTKAEAMRRIRKYPMFMKIKIEE